DGTSKWITGDEARRDAHRLRAASDVVVVGAGTVRADDPRLDVRLEDHVGPQPRPVIVAGEDPLPGDAALWSRDPLVYSAKPVDTPSGEVVVLSGPAGVDLDAMIKDLESRGTLGILVEGGPGLAGALWSNGLVDRVVAYAGAKVGGGSGLAPLDGVFPTVADATVVSITSVELLGDTVKIMGDC
ncbi:MAG: RibD family protein, partial [Acidimicrobiia bacterium]|nr:RibD family protein [Acidimicrobiia bacterium]